VTIPKADGTPAVTITARKISGKITVETSRPIENLKVIEC